MLKIVILVYVLISGKSIDQPVAFTPPESFVDLEACQLYLKSEAFAARRSGLSRLVTATVSRSEAAKAMAAEEEMPIFDTAITASCEEDNRL